MSAEANSTPRDDFPPHGYLDNRYHSWKLNPSGVLRSRQPASMGWHVPNWGSYGKNQFSYRVHLHVGLEVGGRRLLTPDEFRRARVAVGCDLHTKNRLRYLWAHPAGPRIAATYFVVDEHALACHIALEAASGARQPQTVRLWVAQELAHNPVTSRLWEHGLYAAMPGGREPEPGAAGLLGVCPEGGAWLHGVAASDGVELVPALSSHNSGSWSLDKHATPTREPGGLQTATLFLAYDLVLAPGAPLVLHAVLARGVSADLALRSWWDGLAAFDDVLAECEVEDERFWASAPQLTGDWPKHWRRGVATDFETLRTVVRPPTGVFQRPWDGMQIQAPRTVLAETALDALALSWADPTLARGILLECFAAAPRPNVPCMREDGSYNMVADDGSICGTGPEWGWPLVVAHALWLRSGDDEWLAALYPHAVAYIEWWLANRVDAEGWAVHACSWESGQDVSTRFGKQSSGGSDVRYLRPVDLQAALARGCVLLADWANAVGRSPSERDRWAGLGADYSSRLNASLWQDGWYHDYDARRGCRSEARDPMQLAPLACGVAGPEQTAALQGVFHALPPHCGVYPPLVWPPVAHTALEAALACGLDERAAELAAEILERTWWRMDARELEPDGAIAGVTREFWPEGGRETNAGIEGYGWGALTIHFLIRYLIGLRETGPRSFALIPALPRSLRRPGASYTIGPIAVGGGQVSVTYAVPTAGAADTVDVALALTGPWRGVIVTDVREQHYLARAEATEREPAELRWRGQWLRVVEVSPAS